MKMKYVKPTVTVERFTLAQSIAAGCNSVPGGNTVGKPTHWSRTDCGWDLGSDVLFYETTGDICTQDLGADDVFEAICYNSPNGGNTIFSS